MRVKVSLDFGPQVMEVGTLVYERERYFLSMLLLFFLGDWKFLLTNFFQYAKFLDIRKQEIKLIEKTIQGTLLG